MIKEVIEDFERAKENIRDIIIEKHPEDYEYLVRLVFDCINKGDGYSFLRATPELNQLECIQNGDRQGSLLYVSPDRNNNGFFIVCIYYGSCSGCDTLERIREYSNNKPSPQQVEDYLTLCLHIAQRTMYVN